MHGRVSFESLKVTFLTIVEICFIWHDYDKRFGDIVNNIETLSRNLEAAERFAMVVGVTDMQCKPCHRSSLG